MTHPLTTTLIIAILISGGFGVRLLGTMTSRTCTARFAAVEVGEAPTSFPSEYQVARRQFLAAASEAGARIESIENPRTGPNGEPLFMDVALLGPEDAEHALLLSSGTHGVEGFAGSGIQTRLLAEGIAADLPAGVNLLMVHAINPYGMAHRRRANEDNVDLNRNFRDHSLPHPDNSAYDAIAHLLGPTSLSFWPEAAAWSKILWFWITAGPADAQAAGSRGQYTHAEGLFYGGTFETWSNVTLRAVVRQYLADARRVVSVDVHTGLGESGSAEIILNVPDISAEYERAVAIWGARQVRATVTGESLSTHLEASAKAVLPGMLPASRVTAVSVEFGTVPVLEVTKALRAENWLHHHGGADHPMAEALKTCLLRTFHPGTAEWEAAVWEQGRDVVYRAVGNLAERE